MSVHSVFYTIQGEGPFAGQPAVFIRLYGCNLQCPFCDTDYTSEREEWESDQLAAFACAKFKAAVRPLVVLSGGEPLRQPIASLITHLMDQGATVQIETNGTLPPPDLPPWYLDDVVFVVSPKTGTVNPHLAVCADIYKYVISSRAKLGSDGLPDRALDHTAHPRLARPLEGFPPYKIYVQPEDPDPGADNLDKCVEIAMAHGYRVSLQQHKIIGVP